MVRLVVAVTVAEKPVAGKVAGKEAARTAVGLEAAERVGTAEWVAGAVVEPVVGYGTRMHCTKRREDRHCGCGAMPPSRRQQMCPRCIGMGRRSTRCESTTADSQKG